MSGLDARGNGSSPFVGPRPFRMGETLYGRDREVRELVDLLIADRIVLLYSPSGAGKTSLIQSLLIPALRDQEGFRVLPGTADFPVIRVGQEPDEANGGKTNRYVASTLWHLEKALHAMDVGDGQASTTLAQFLATRVWPGEGPEPGLLIFDQFEEVLTADPTDLAAKDDFFAQLGEALRNRNLWALFSMREDYVPPLDPYLRRIPRQFGTRYRLDMLTKEAALKAIVEPTKGSGVEITPDTAEYLVDELSRVRVQQGGSVVWKEGPYIEPVQLQVVCLRLWQKSRDAGKPLVDYRPADPEQPADDITLLADVDGALEEYYAERVHAIHRATGVSERAIRDWCETRLITGQGIRNQVPAEGMGGTPQGLSAEILEMLGGAYLIRSESRRGVLWYELAHDRLIEPIRKDNARWREVALSLLQRQAALWLEKGRQDGFLLHDQILQEAERWAEEHVNEVSPAEREFLEESRKVRESRREERKNRQIRILAVFASIVGLLAIGASLVAFYFYRYEQVQARLATARELAALSIKNLRVNPGESLRLARQSVDVTVRASGDVSEEARDALQQAVLALRVRWSRTLRDKNDVPTRLFDVAFSPDGRRVAAACEDGVARIWDITADPDVGQAPVVLDGPGGHSGQVFGIVFSPDGRRVVTTGTDGAALVWDVGTPAGAGRSRVVGKHPAQVYKIALSPDGRRVATACADGVARIWDVEVGADAGRPRVSLGGPDGHQGAVYDIAFSPDGRRVVTAGHDRTARVWDVEQGSDNGRPRAVLAGPGGHSDEVFGVAFSPDGCRVATTSRDRTVRLWNLALGTVAATITGHTDTVFSVAFSPDGKRLCTASADGLSKCWELATGRELFTLSGHSKPLSRVVFNRDGTCVATAGWDGAVKVWDATFFGHTDVIAAVEISADGKSLATASYDRTAKVWDTVSGKELATLAGHEREVCDVAFSPDSTQLATASWDGAARLWDWRSPGGPRVVREFRHGDQVNAVAFSRDGRMIASGGRDGQVLIWDVESGTRRHTLKGHVADVNCVSFAPKGDFLATAGADGTARIWDVRRGVEIGGFRSGTGNAVRSVEFSPNSRCLVMAGMDPLITVWHLATRKPLFTLPARAGEPGHSLPVTAVVFRRDGAFLATAGEEGVAKVWDLHSRRAIMTLYGHEGPVYGVSFTPDGKRLATVGADGRILLDILDLGTLIKASNQMARALR